MGTLFAVSDLPSLAQSEEGLGLGWLGSVLQTLAGGAIAPIAAFLRGDERFSWPFVGAMLIISFGCFLAYRKGSDQEDAGSFFSFLRIKDVYLHRSSLLDYRYWILNASLKSLLFVPLFGSGTVVSATGIHAVLSNSLGSERTFTDPGAATLLAYSVLSLLLIDLGNYWNHRLYHTVPALWELHKAHHSAPVLNPVTAARKHPIESLTDGFASGVFSGLALGAAVYFWGPTSPLTVFGVHAAAFFTNLVSGNLRHSHIWLSYGPRFEHVLSSPAQHQIHHSDQERHFDKNFAVHFSLWDWAFGTLYTTTSMPEDLTFGIGQEGKEYDTVFKLWLLPLKKIWLMRPGGAPPISAAEAS